MQSYYETFRVLSSSSASLIRAKDNTSLRLNDSQDDDSILRSMGYEPTLYRFFLSAHGLVSGFS
jgi:hypothetical protein